MIQHHDIGDRLEVEGTVAHRASLEQLAQAVRPFAPGAAAALLDWTGTEIARLRAYAVAHAVLRERLAEAQLEARFAVSTRAGFRLVA